MTIKKYSVLTQMSFTDASFSLNERKILNFLLYLKETQKGDIYLTSIKDIKTFLDTKYNNKSILQSLENLCTKKTVINILNKDKNFTSSEMLILSHLKRNSDYSIEFKFSKEIEYLTTSTNLYSKLDLKVVNKFNSKYSIALFEIINDYKNVSLPAFTIETFKNVMGAEYSNFTTLKNKAISVAIKEINSKTLFNVSYTTQKIGKTYRFITITFKDISRDKIFKVFIDFMIKNNLERVIKTKNKEIIISNSLSLLEWKVLYLNRNKLSFFSDKLFSYYLDMRENK